MVSSWLRSNTSFGVCLIARGHEVGAAAEPHTTGTLAEIVSWDMVRPGILQLVIGGGQGFRVRERRVQPDQGTTSGSHDCCRHSCLSAQGYDPIVPGRRNNAVWVSWRLAEILPLTAAQWQALLEEPPGERRLAAIAELMADTTVAEK